MKKLIATLLITVCSSCIQADTKATAKNVEGGKIVLTDEQCQVDPRMLRSYTYTKSHYTEEGCWVDDDLTILVKWEKMGVMRYEKRKFKVVKEW
jgi:hypothetical protein